MPMQFFRTCASIDNVIRISSVSISILVKSQSLQYNVRIYNFQYKTDDFCVYLQQLSKVSYMLFCIHHALRNRTLKTAG